MSTKINSTNNLKTLSKAVSLMTFAGISSYSQAVDFGRINIVSKQYEPLNASISVENINKNNFDVSMANQAIYKQMGLQPNTRVAVNFVRTSKNSGKIVLTSSTPINEPFADIVLKIKDNDAKQFLPKTLLMPVGSKPVAPQPKQVVMDTQQTQNIPVVTAVAPKPTAPKPVVPQVTTPTVVSATNQNQEPPIQDHEIAALRGDNQYSNKTQQKTETKARNQIETVKSKNTTNIKAHQNTQKKPTAQKPVRKTPTFAQNSVSSEPPIGSLSSDQHVLTNPQIQQVAKKSNTSKPKIPATKTASGQHTYIVQRNDNLWTIANEIAKRNKVSVSKVMNEIYANNPSAFIKGNKSRIIARSELTLPDYKVVPSQKSLQDAIASRNTSASKKNKKSKAQARKARVTAKINRKKSNQYSTTNRRNSQKVALVTKQNKNTKVRKSTNGSSVTAKTGLVSKLKTSRQITAKKATKVSSLSNKVDSYSQKLQLQNKKLAELEARLKQLKGK